MGVPLFWTVLRMNDRCKTVFENLEGTDIDLEGVKKCFKQSIDPQINIALALLRQIKAIISKDKPLTKNNHKLSPCERYLLLRLIFGDLENKKYDEVYAAMYSVILDVGSSEIQNITSPYNNARRLLMGEVDWDDIKESKQNDLKDALTNIESFLDKEFSSKIDILWTKLGKKN